MSRRAEVLMAALLLGAAACGEKGQATAPARESRKVVVAIDLSGSQSAGRLAEARNALDMIIDGLQYEDRLVLLRVSQRSAVEDDGVRWEQGFPAQSGRPDPSSLDRERLLAARQGARSVVETLFDTQSAGRLPRTDLIATLHVAAEYVRGERAQPVRLILLSDMLQSAHDIEMSESVPGRAWIDDQRAQDLLPDLGGACVTIIGADATTPNGIAVREFWIRYLEEAGAQVSAQSYRLFAADTSALSCG